MDQVTLTADQRADFGSRQARRLRRAGKVPAVMYGRSATHHLISVDARDLYTVLHTGAGLNALINLEIDGQDPVLTVARELQRHPVRGEITHLDFIQVSLDTAIQADVAIDFTGSPLGVREDGGVLETIEVSVLIEALPTQIPASIPVAVDDLRIGDGLRIADLPTLEGVTYVDDAERPLVTVVAPRIIEEEVPEEELEGELVEGEEAPEADGEEAAEEAATEEEG